MSPLELPRELFDRVIEAVVVQNGVHEAMGNRLVCKAFDHSIILGISTSNSLEGDGAITSYLGMSLLTTYITTRVLADRACTLHISQAIRDVINQIFIHRPKDQSHDLRLRYTHSLCKATIDGYCDYRYGKGYQDLIFHILLQPEMKSRAFPLIEHVLSAAIYLGIDDLADKLIKERVAMEYTYFGSPICNAARTGDVAKMRDLISYCPRVFDLYPGLAEFLVAATAGKLDILEFLLNHEIGSSLYYPIRTPGGVDGILRAARNGHSEVLELLLQQPVHTPTGESKIEIEHPLGLQQRILWEAAIGGHKELAREAIARGADVNGAPISQDATLEHDPTTYDTAVCLAAKYGRKDMLKFLLDEQGANLECTKCGPSGALKNAVKNGWEDTAMMLLERDVSVNAKITTMEDNPLVAAASRGQRICVQLLLANNASLVVDGKAVGRYAYHQAATHNFTGVMSLLAERGVYPILAIPLDQ
ncbi:ankyrin repeat-containing domain protein [Amylocarpus encephaloides]|uniref:Ankyrin repeat-containing domain protein n=1 Tax=Amylocarpus encephaloides TaxID=45428 RepID=A0A9P8C0J8_9HELO|nr:ankyrin repeat-containing domain protein [Amylocarpus encephaloides]